MAVWEKLCSDKVVCGVSVVTTIVSIICAILVATRFNQMGTINHGQQTEAMNKSFDWCPPCDILANRNSPDLLKLMDKKLIGGVEHCCAHNSAQATRLLELMATKAEPEVERNFKTSSFPLSKASAHKQLTLTSFRSIDEPVFVENENVNLEFDPYLDDPLIDHVRNVTVMKYAMIVQIPGQYFVYSGIFFQPDSSTPCKELAKQTWEHNIVLTRDKGSSGIILNTTYTCCNDCVQPKKTTYAGGLFHLQENDHLHVEISSDGIFSMRKESSYFGLFLLE